jgi:FkbM family methyltransferase
MKQIRGFWWPEHDRDAHPVVSFQSKDIDAVMKYVSGGTACIQAGGNVGVWAKRFSGLFDTVYTFEPDPYNFACLIKNVPEQNVVKMNAALGHERTLVKVGPPDVAHINNCGAYQVLGKGVIPTFLIDDLNLPICDLMYLDIEGYEMFAILGALDTIERCKPVIALEQKPLPLMYGYEPESASEFLVKEMGYEVAQRVNRDIILIPR